MKEPLFEPSQAELWQKLGQGLRALFPAESLSIEGDTWSMGKIQVHYQNWTVTLDFYGPGYSSTTGSHQTQYTRLRAPYVNRDQFRFKIYRGDILSDLGKHLGLQDIEIGEPEFDAAFILQGNDPAKVKALLTPASLRAAIQAQSEFHLEVRDDEGWFGAEFPEGVDELVFQVPGMITEVERLKSLYLLFAEVLNRLCHLGSAYAEDPHFKL